MAGPPTNVSVRDVARLAGVSVGTVSNVINGRVKVAPATKERVETAITQLGFVPNSSARQLRTGRSTTVGLLVIDLTNPFFSALAGGVEDAMWEDGVSVILCNAREDREREAAYLEALAKQRVAGLVASLMTGEPERLLALRHAGTPIVLADRPAPSAAFPTVTFEEQAGGTMAARHLIERGHRSAAFIGCKLFAQVDSRLAGARLAWAEADLTASDLTVIDTDSMTVEAGAEAGERFLALTPRPTAALCANDLIALGFLQTMTRHEVRVPHEVAIVGYDDIDLTAGAAAIPLTSVRKPACEMGAAAAAMLATEQDRLDHRPADPPEHRSFAPSLVVRQSS